MNPHNSFVKAWSVDAEVVKVAKERFYSQLCLAGSEALGHLRKFGRKNPVHGVSSPR
jgi:hypothetical protein